MSTSRLLILFIMISFLTLSGCSSDGGSRSTDTYGDMDVVTDGDAPVADGDSDADSVDSNVSDGDTETDGDTEQEAADPCNTNPCEDTNKTTCANDGEGNAVCSCDDGFEDYGDGRCKPSDPCISDIACAGENRECENNQGVAECGDCIGGYHADADACVVDVDCGDNSCNSNGDCNDDTGVPVCACTTGYVGDHCEACDAEKGWHWNASGDACTNNPCDQNPCNAEDHRICEAGTGNCVCDDGYCDIGGVCIADDTENPDHVCLVCDSAANKNDWSLRAAGYECRAAAGVCDMAESCDGLNNDCPADGFVVDGEVCEDDANACNGVNTCVSGSCDETTATVTCECHVAGTCNTETGVCTDPVSNDGEVCEDDNNACNGVNTCVSGSCDETTASVTCTALDECHIAGVCDTSSGVCSNPTGHEGDLCEDDDNACNGVNTCQSGSCDETTDPVTCTALDECHIAGVCDTGTGVCSNPNADDGAVCETTNQCVSGTCEDCFDAAGCLDLAWGDRVDGCSDRICNFDNTCEFEDETDGSNCGDDDLDQCVTGQCLDCFAATGCSDLAWDERSEECSEQVCGEDHVCGFNDTFPGTECSVDDQCDGSGLCVDCVDSYGCDGYTEDENPCTSLACEDNSCTDANDNTNTCDLGHDCTGDHCVDGSCLVETVTTGCLIENVCVGDGISQDDDGCVACDPSVNDRDWTDMDGSVCAVTDDGNPCTNDVCDGGVCISVNDDTNTCSDEVGCTETVCSSGDCIVSGTNTGCYIEEACYEEGVTEEETGNGSCQVCESVSDWDGWTIKESGSCDDDNICTHTDTCRTGGTCTGVAYSCNNHGNCDGMGSCICDLGYAGAFCDKCATGFDNYPDCDHCALGAMGIYPHCSLFPDFVSIPAGYFWSGSPEYCSGPEGYPGDCEAELGRWLNEDLHYTHLTYDFEVQTSEATQGQWKAIAHQEGWGINPSYFSICGDDCPVERVNYFEALAFANGLSRHAGLPECYVLSDCTGIIGEGCADDEESCFTGYECLVFLNSVNKPQDCPGYRLPTEAEWEYSIRAGSNTAFYPSPGNDGSITNTGCDPNLNQISWYSCNSYVDPQQSTHPVATKAPNDWGLYDMSGNVAEWTWDWYEWDYPTGTFSNPLVNPTGPSTGSGRVVRGGSFTYSANECRSANRGGVAPNTRVLLLGLRLSKTIPGPDCSDDPCNGNGTCENDSLSTICECDEGYEGRWCDQCADGYIEYPNCTPDPCIPDPCNGHGICDSSDGSCVCDNPRMNDDCSACLPGIGNYPLCNHCKIGFENFPECHTVNFIPITAGFFWSGSPNGCPSPEGYPGDCETELGRESCETLHYVQLTYGFEMGSFEVTQEEFLSLMGYNPSSETACGLDCPVEQVSWHEALAYANALSQERQLDQCYYCTGSQPDFTCSLKPGYLMPQDCLGYRLPTEAEWEYSVRAGSNTAFYPSDGNNGTITYPNTGLDPNLDIIAWFIHNSDMGSGLTTHPVGLKAPNNWGLFDMSGNVLEWTWDWYDENYPTGTYSDPLVDPTGPSTGSGRVNRGGHNYTWAFTCRSAKRWGASPGIRPSGWGFRLVRSLSDPTCKEEACNGHGDCDDTGERVSCTCHDGYDGYWCNRCAPSYQGYPDCCPEGYHGPDCDSLPSVEISGLDCSADGDYCTKGHTYPLTFDYSCGDTFSATEMQSCVPGIFSPNSGDVTGSPTTIDYTPASTCVGQVILQVEVCNNSGCSNDTWTEDIW